MGGGEAPADVAPDLSPPPFTYTELDPRKRQIRLLRIEKVDSVARAEEPTVVCWLEVASLDVQVPFLALSYSWDNETGSQIISLDGRPFDVTQNLHKALLQLRSTLPSDGTSRPRGKGNFQHSTGFTTGAIWIDAVCINQEDNDEKGWQVSQMSDVYKAAVEVVVWLGPQSHGSKEALDHFNEVGSTALANGLLRVAQWPVWFEERKAEAVRSTGEKPTGSTPLERYFWWFVTQNAIPAEDDVSWLSTAIRALLSRSWWSRMWVVQEVMLAKHVYFLCGPDGIPGEHIEVTFLFYSTAMYIRMIWLTKRIDGLIGDWFGGVRDELDKLEEEAVNANDEEEEEDMAWIGTVRKYASPYLVNYLKSVFSATNKYAPFLTLQAGVMLAEGSLQRRFCQSALSLRRAYILREHLHADFRLGTLLYTVTSEDDRRESTDLRDIIYALYGLLDDSERAKFVPNYNKSVEEVFVDATKTCLRAGHLNVLSLNQWPKKHNELPSWAPDWSVPLRRPLASITAPNAAIHRIQFLHNSTGDEVLCIGGMSHVKDISIVDAFLPEDADPKGIAEGIHTAYQQSCWALNAKGACTSSAARRASFIRLLLASRTWEDRTPDEDYPTAADLDGGPLTWNNDIPSTDIRNLTYYLDAVLRGQNPTKLSFMEELENYEAEMNSWEFPDEVGSLTGMMTLASTMWKSLKTGTKLLRSANEARNNPGPIRRSTCRHTALKVAQRTLRRKRVFVADRGIMGLCPDTATDGDVVALFDGSSMPYVLRSLDDRYHQLIGEAFLDAGQRQTSEPLGKLADSQSFLIC